MPPIGINPHILGGSYAALLLPISASSLTFSDFDNILSGGTRTMLYATVLGNPDGSFTPVSGFENVVPLSSTRNSSRDRESIALEQLRITSPPPGPPISITSRGPQTRAQSVSAIASAPVSSSITKRSASRASTPQTTTIVPGSENLNPIRESKALRHSEGNKGNGGSTVWYHTQAPYALNLPRPIPGEIDVGTVYIHTNSSTMSRQVWVWMNNRVWRVFSYPDILAHPVYPDRFLWVHRATGIPSWVVRATLNTYMYKEAKDSVSKV